MEYTCNICGVTKSTSEFRSKNKCKLCRDKYLKAHRKVYYDDNKVRLNKERGVWNKNNPEKARITAIKTRKKNKVKMSECSRLYNKVHRRELTEKEAQRTKTDVNFKLRKRLRSRLYAAMRVYKGGKHTSVVNLLGCSISELKDYLASKFLPTMTWENYGGYWHIDHLIPCVLFDLSKEEDQRKCFHYTNLQPLFAITQTIDGVEYIGNMSKHIKIIKY